MAQTFGMDQQLLLYINREWTSPFLDWFMAVMSSWDVWFIPVIGAAICFFVFGGFRGRMMLLCIALVLGIVEGVAVRLLKDHVERPRPHEVLADVRQVQLVRKVTPRFLAIFRPAKVKLSRPEPGEPGGRSFPSAHTIDNMCVAMILTLFYRRRGWLWFIPATTIAYSRIYVGSHWPSDVLISILIGLGLTFVLMTFFEWAWRRFGAPRWPKHPSLFADS